MARASASQPTLSARRGSLWPETTKGMLKRSGQTVAGAEMRKAMDKESDILPAISEYQKSI